MTEIEAKAAALANQRVVSDPGARRERPAKPPRRGRPAFGVVVGVTAGFRVGREILDRVAFSRYGLVGVIAIAAAGLAIVLGWRTHQRWRARRRGGIEFAAEDVARQLVDSGLGPPAFDEDGTLLGASVLVVNQRAKVLEVNTEYEVFSSDATPLGTIRQIAQSRAKRMARILTALDQFFTHHFEILGADGAVVLRVTRPRKIFLTKLHVFDAGDRFIGTIRQQNIFWKIHFQILDAVGNVVGAMHAENVRAWDFQVNDAVGRNIATVVKSWEGWARTAFTRADRYVVRIHHQLGHPLRELALATALTADLALKQDARGIG